jgi:hypothetical protein
MGMDVSEWYVYTHRKICLFVLEYVYVYMNAQTGLKMSIDY